LAPTGLGRSFYPDNAGSRYKRFGALD